MTTPRALPTVHAADYAADIGGIVDTLQAKGAHDIVVWNTPNVGLTPAVLAVGPGASFLGMSIAETMNSALAARLFGEPGVQTFDVFDLLSTVVAHPGDFGLSNVSDACGASVTCDPSQYLFWDGIHPTSAGHLIVADAMTHAVPEPSIYATLLIGLVLLAGAARRKGFPVLKG